MGSNDMAKEFGVVLCVDCPKERRHVPVNGNCVDFRLRESGKPMYGDVRLHGEPSDFFYDQKEKCEYARGVTSGGFTADLRGIMCTYQEKKEEPK